MVRLHDLERIPQKLQILPARYTTRGFPRKLFKSALGTAKLFRSVSEDGKQGPVSLARHAHTFKEVLSLQSGLPVRLGHDCVVGAVVAKNLVTLLDGPDREDDRRVAKVDAGDAGVARVVQDAQRRVRGGGQLKVLGSWMTISSTVWALHG